MVERIPVAEIFGPTIQGEGPLAGTPCSFLRLGGCDYKCVWCDTPYAVLPDQVRTLARLNAREIVEGIHALHAESRWLVVSGGNPAMHDLTEVVQTLRRVGWKVQVETQGTRWHDWLNLTDMLVVSPKPPSSQQKERKNQGLWDFLAQVPPNDRVKKTSLKVVVFTQEDLDYATTTHKRYPEIPFYISCGTIPRQAVNDQATLDSLGSPDTLDTLRGRYRWLAEAVARSRELVDVRVLPQLHYLAWGGERSR